MKSFDNEFETSVAVDDVSINLMDLMDDVSDEALEWYCNKRGVGNSSYKPNDMVDAYYHGDLDALAFLRKLGKKTVQKLIEEM